MSDIDNVIEAEEVEEPKELTLKFGEVTVTVAGFEKNIQVIQALREAAAPANLINIADYFKWEL